MAKPNDSLSIEARHGKQFNQKIKPYVVLQYLLKNTDADHVATAYDIIAFLEERGLTAERRSIYKDIAEINRIMVMLEEDCTIDEADEMLAEDDTLKTVVYDHRQKGFFVRQRHFDLYDIRLLAECVYAAKFVTEGQAQRLVNVVCDFVSDAQAERIKHNAFLIDRVKTVNKSVMNNLAKISNAMSKKMDGKSHEPEKITFKYLQYTIEAIGQQIERKGGKRYKVSPHQLLINDGQYYLLAFDDLRKEIRTYRVDRMKDVSLTGEKRIGEEAFEKLNISTYVTRTFSMFGGKTQRITIQMELPLLDTAIERFGIKDAVYNKTDEEHFTVSAVVEISNLFYGWLCGFGQRAKLIAPDETVKEFSTYLDEMRSQYEIPQTE